jgi:rhodanese-related sulfurtransferase
MLFVFDFEFFIVRVLEQIYYFGESLSSFLDRDKRFPYNSIILLNAITMTNKQNESSKSKEQLYHLFASLASALANPHRLELLDLLVQAPRTVEELARQSHMGVANTSQHLQRLKQSRLVIDTRDGQFIRYYLASPAVARLWLELRNVAELQLAEVERALQAYRPRRHSFDRISISELQERLVRDDVVLLDVRPEAEFMAGHLPGSVSIPLDELEGRLHELPPGKLIVAYCRGPYCVFADEALELLTQRGWKVARLEEGVAEWQVAGLNIEKHDKEGGINYVGKTVRGRGPW